MTVLQDSELTEFLKRFDITDLPFEPFSPFVFYNKDGDSLEFYVSLNNFYSEHINNYLTLLRDMDSNVVAGFIINNIKSILSGLAGKGHGLKFIT